MSLPLHVLRPLAQGFAAGLLLAVTGCGVSSKPDSASVSSPAQAELKTESSVHHELLDADASMSKRNVRPAPMAGFAPMPAGEAYPQGYRDEQREQYQALADNPIHSVAETPVSTFSADVDTGAYANVRRLLNQGRLPPEGAVRLEEMVNYFPYDYAFAHRWLALRRDHGTGGVALEFAYALVAHRHQGLGSRGRETGPGEPGVPGGRVRLDGSPRGPPVGQKHPEIAGGSTARSGSGVLGDLRRGIARGTGAHFRTGKSEDSYSHRAIDCRRFNRRSDFDSLKQMAVDKRKTGVSLTTLGFGVDNYNEHLMEQLADAGDGNYAYIDNLREARKVLVEQLGSTLAVVAKNVKLQVEFNPAQVSEYRLLGYENRALKVDAGEIGAGHTVTALYEIVPKGEKGWLEPLRYAQPGAAIAEKHGELAMLRVRYQLPEGGKSRLIERPIIDDPVGKASDDLRFAAAVAAFSQQLKDGRYTGEFSLKDTEALARDARGDDRFGLRSEFVQLVELAQSLGTTTASNPTATERRIE